MTLPFFFFFNDTATTEIYTLSLHDALPIYRHVAPLECRVQLVALRDRYAQVVLAVLDQCRRERPARTDLAGLRAVQDRKSTRLNSSHSQISYAVFCLKKKKTHCTRSTSAYC